MDSTPAPVRRDPLEALRAAFGTGDLRRLQFGWAATSVGSWAFMVVLAVYAYDVGGASAVGVAALVRMLPGRVHRAGDEPAGRPQLAPRRDGAGDARALGAAWR